MLAKQIKEYTKAIGDLFGFINGTEIYIYWPGKED